MKPRLKMLRRDGDAIKYKLTFYAGDGRVLSERPVMLSNLEMLVDVVRHGYESMVDYKVRKAIKEHARDVAAGLGA